MLLDPGVKGSTPRAASAEHGHRTAKITGKRQESPARDTTLRQTGDADPDLDVAEL